MGSLPFRFDTLIIPFLVYSFNSFIVHFYEQSVNFIKNALLPKPYTAFAETFSYKKRRRTLEKTVARANGERFSPALAYSYCDRCKSINMRPQGDELFTCVASFCAERKVGDQTK